MNKDNQRAKGTEYCPFPTEPKYSGMGESPGLEGQSYNDTAEGILSRQKARQSKIKSQMTKERR